MEYVIRVRPWLTKTKQNPVPMATMAGTVMRETPKAIYASMRGIIAPSSLCLHCGRKLTHPVSLFYGIGPICGGHFHLPMPEDEEAVRANWARMERAISDVKWFGWIPKSQIAECAEWNGTLPEKWGEEETYCADGSATQFMASPHAETPLATKTVTTTHAAKNKRQNDPTVYTMGSTATCALSGKDYFGPPTPCAGDIRAYRLEGSEVVAYVYDTPQWETTRIEFVAYVCMRHHGVWARAIEEENRRTATMRYATRRDIVPA